MDKFVERTSFGLSRGHIETAEDWDSDETNTVIAAEWDGLPKNGVRQFGAAAADGSGRSNISERVEEILRAEWGT